jgi:hypothetical protein
MLRTVLSMGAILVVSLVSTPRAMMGRQCSGCVGSGLGGGANNGTIDITISVTMTSGTCKPVMLIDPPIPGCKAKSCRANIQASWTGGPAGGSVPVCMDFADPYLTWCLEPPPTSDSSGAGTSSTPNVPIPCNEGTNEYSVTVGSLTASVFVECSDCP